MLIGLLYVQVRQLLLKTIIKFTITMMESKINVKRRSVIEETEDENEAFVSDDTIAKKDIENPNKGALYYMLNNHQWVFAIWLIPISLCYDIFWWCRARTTYWLCRRNSNMRLFKNLNY